MFNATAKAGEAVSLVNLPGEILEKLKVRGNGHLRIDREGHSHFVRWVRQARPETAGPVADRRLLCLTAPIAGEQGVDGPVVPFARHEAANMPVFARRALNDPELEGTVAITYSPDTSETSVDRLPQE